MTKQQPGGEFAGAWASLAAAATKRRRGWGGEYPQYTTAELIRDANDDFCDEATRSKLEAEIARRNTRRGSSK